MYMQKIIITKNLNIKNLYLPVDDVVSVLIEIKSDSPNTLPAITLIV